jgi:hypothetical protein
MGKIKKSEIMELGGPTAFLETLTWAQGVDDCAKENGFTLHCENEPTVLNPLAMTYWSLEMAMVWIAFRDLRQVGRVWPEYRRDCCLELQGFYDDGGQVRGELQTPSVSSVWADLWFSRDVDVPLEAASELLRLKLESGAISATGVIQSGERKAIVNYEWCDLYFYFRHHDKGDCIVSTAAKKWNPDTLPEYTRVRVPVKEMLREFPAHDADKVQSEKAADKPNLEAILKAAIEKHGYLPQRRAAKIAREGGAIEPRKKILDLLEILQGPQKPGPKGPRNNAPTRLRNFAQLHISTSKKMSLNFHVDPGHSGQCLSLLEDRQCQIRRFFAVTPPLNT